MEQATVNKPRLTVGRLNGEDASLLRRLAEGRDVLQLGCYCGKGTVILANVARRTWVLESFADYTGGSGAVLEELKANVEANVPEEKELYFLRGTTGSWGVPAGSGRQLGAVQMVYRDADRSLGTEEADQEFAARLMLTHGGTYAWHDAEGKLKWLELLPAQHPGEVEMAASGRYPT